MGAVEKLEIIKTARLSVFRMLLSITSNPSSQVLLSGWEKISETANMVTNTLKCVSKRVTECPPTF